MATAESQSSYSSETVNAWRLTTVIPVTNDQLMDSNFDMENEISIDVGESFAQKEGNKHILGTSVKQPEGIMANATLQAAAATSSTTGTLTAADLTTMTGAIKAGQNPMYGFNRQTLATIRTLETSNGDLIFHAGSFDGGDGGSRPNRINGEPYAVFQDIASLAAGSYSVFYGDLRRGYTIVDRTGLAVIRDDVTAANQAIVKFTFHRYTTGQVILTEAFALLLTKS